MRKWVENQQISKGGVKQQQEISTAMTTKHSTENGENNDGVITKEGNSSSSTVRLGCQRKIMDFLELVEEDTNKDCD